MVHPCPFGFHPLTHKPERSVDLIWMVTINDFIHRLRSHNHLVQNNWNSTTWVLGNLHLACVLCLPRRDAGALLARHAIFPRQRTFVREENCVTSQKERHFAREANALFISLSHRLKRSTTLYKKINDTLSVKDYSIAFMGSSASTNGAVHGLVSRRH